MVLTNKMEFQQKLQYIQKLFFVFLLLLLPLIGSSQKNCSVVNTTFQAGEKLTYIINYNWGAIWMTTGEVTFAATKADYNNNKVYHFTGVGGTYPKYDWFFKVRDTYESYVDTTTFKPLRFVRVVNEGSNHLKDDCIFNHQKNKVFTLQTKTEKPTKFDSLSITPCTNDVMTAIFYARCLDFSVHKPNDTIPITFVLDGAIFYSYIRYMGTEVIHSDLLGDVRCIKFKPKLIEGTIFKEGEGMTVWVTDDMNKIPVYVETPIIVGTIKVSLGKYEGLRNPITCFSKK